MRTTTRVRISFLSGFVAVLVLAVTASGLIAGCRKVEPDQEEPRAGSSEGQAGETGTKGETPRTVAASESSAPESSDKPSVRLEREPWQSLLREAHRAEIDSGGLWIDLGGSTGELYTLGSWTRGWTTPEGGDGRSLAIDEDMAWLALPPSRSPAAELVARVKGRCEGQTLFLSGGAEPVSALEASEPPVSKVDVDGADGGVPIDVNWSIIRLPMTRLSDSTRLGLGTQGADCELAESERGLLSVDWLFVASESGAAPPRDLVVDSASDSRAAEPINIGNRVRRGLMSPGTRTWRFYLQVPESASLVADMGSQAEGTEFVVHAHADGEASRELFRQTPPGGQWTEADVDLNDYANKLILLELTTETADPMSESEAGWGEPSIMVAGEGSGKEGERKAQKKSKKEPAGDDATGGEGAQGASAAPGVSVTADAHAKNVIFIVIDTARADAFGPIPPDTVVKTPEYDQLAARGTVFTAAWNNSNWTKPSVASMLSGLYPYVHGAQGKRDVFPKEIGLVSETLQTAGFSTGGFVSNGFISDRFGFERGWDIFTNYPREQLMQNARNVYEDAWKWVKEKHEDDSRVFAYIQTSDPHVPYWVGRRWSKMYYPDSYNGPIGDELDGHRQEELSGDHEALSEDDYRWIRALYFGEITYHDYHMGLFLDRLGSLDGFLDDTLVIVTNDHGEEVDDHGEMGHGHTLFDELVRAPLTMVFPRRIPAERSVDTVVESVDIPVTLLELAGLEPVAAHQGLSLSPLWESDSVPEMRRDATAVATWRKDKRALRYGQYKLICSSDGSWASLFNVIDDPSESQDVLNEHPIVRRVLELRLADAHSRPDKLQRFEGAGGRGQTFEARPSDLDPALEKQLEALGYFGE